MAIPPSPYQGRSSQAIGVDTPEVHESGKLYRDAQRTARDVRARVALGKKASAFTRSLVDKKEIRLEYDQAKLISATGTGMVVTS